jgi:hypothetical protein
MEDDHAEAPKENIFMKKYRFPLMLAFLVAFFNQMSGINAFLYYAPRIFGEAGLGEKTALLSSIGIGLSIWFLRWLVLISLTKLVEEP